MATSTAQSVFSNMSPKDHLHFYQGGKLQPKEVVRFLDFKNEDVSKAAGVPISSVRYDVQIPKELEERLLQIANICLLVADFFSGDRARAATWFKLENPLLGGISPRDMIRLGKYKKLLKIVTSSLQGVAP